jgi:hypothetical protein
MPDQTMKFKYRYMPSITYHIETETKQELGVMIDYEARTEKGFTEYEGAVLYCLEPGLHSECDTNCYTFNFKRDHAWKYVMDAGIFECEVSFGNDPLPVLQEVMYMVAEYERENN